MSSSAATTYDSIRYPNFALPQTHPDRLAAIATLFGMCPAPMDRCRVLELGCGEAGNLIPMAYQLPHGRFTGVDLASEPIADGRAAAESLGLTNIDLRCADIVDIGPDWGVFDYIIAHGLYSWVPARVQDRLLSICNANLAPHGVAYISYNTYPGAHMRQMMREMMLFHTRGIDDAPAKISEAVGLLSLLAAGQNATAQPNVALQKELAQICAYQSAALLYHDDMAPANTPVYFQQFAEHAAGHGLQFLGEADFFEMQDQIYPDAVRDGLQRYAGNQVLLKEQYLDFLKCRRFRQTLLCHRGLPLEREIQPERIMGLAISSQVRPISADPDLRSTAQEAFRGPNGAAMQTGHPLSKAAMACLGEAWPRRIPFVELAALAHARLGVAPQTDNALRDPDAGTLAGMLIGAYSAGLVELHAHAPQFALRAGERPLASALARSQAAAGSAHLTTLLHTTIKVEDPIGAALVRLLDGSRDRAALVRDLTSAVEAGALALPGDAEGQELVACRIARDLEPSLAALARSGLLAA